jgi:predicted nucleic acid-binding protein
MKFFLDSNVLIFANISDTPEYPIVHSLIHKYVRNGDQFLINSIIVSEVHYKLRKFLGIDESEQRIKKILTSSYVTYLPIEYSTILSAIILSSRMNVMTNDAIIGQHALDVNSEGILTDNYKDFKKIPGLPIIPIR